MSTDVFSKLKSEVSKLTGNASSTLKGGMKGAVLIIIGFFVLVSLAGAYGEMSMTPEQKAKRLRDSEESVKRWHEEQAKNAEVERQVRLLKAQAEVEEARNGRQTTSSTPTTSSSTLTTAQKDFIAQLKELVAPRRAELGAAYKQYASSGASMESCSRAISYRQGYEWGFDVHEGKKINEALARELEDGYLRGIATMQGQVHQDWSAGFEDGRAGRIAVLDRGPNATSTSQADPDDVQALREAIRQERESRR